MARKAVPDLFKGLKKKEKRVVMQTLREEVLKRREELIAEINNIPLDLNIYNGRPELHLDLKFASVRGTLFRDEFYVSWLYVTPSLRYGLEIGKTLLSKVENYLRNMNRIAKALESERSIKLRITKRITIEANIVAQIGEVKSAKIHPLPFYEKLGFKIDYEKLAKDGLTLEYCLRENYSIPMYKEL